jgi:hypothetical protein
MQEGRQQSQTFTSPQTQEVLAAASLRFFAAEGYTVIGNDSRAVRAEKERAASGGGRQVDVLTVYFTSVPEGTQVRVQALTERLDGGRRSQADQVSLEAIQDAQSLADALMRLGRTVQAIRTRFASGPSASSRG